MLKIKYCPAQEFLDNFLPKEVEYRVQKFVGGGGRVLLYFNSDFMAETNNPSPFIKEFGRKYLGEPSATSSRFFLH
ncbi:MAG: hypothetical protein LBT84_06530 [Spirochaetia bacterium]|jgi:hypothetical protein|nr:hypothetical protein [Spirochaetia bacterium]